MAIRDEAGRLLNQGFDQQSAGDWPAAVALYMRAAELDPTYFKPVMNAGLIHKWRSEWREGLSSFSRALELVDPDDDTSKSIAWNLGICASALSEWPSAFVAWERLGLPVKRAEDGSPELLVGTTPLRLPPPEGGDGMGEIVWTERFDPVRATIESIPTPESGFRYHDVVLHDAAPLGKYRDTGQSLFQVLKLLVRSRFETWTLSVQEAETNNGDVIEGFVLTAEGEALFDDVAVEDFSTTLTLIHSHEGDYHDTARPERKVADRRTVAIAARSEHHLRRLLTAWRRARPGRWHDEPFRAG